MSETISLGALISQAIDPPQTSNEEHNMINSLCEIRNSLKSIHTSSKQNVESNVNKASKIDDDINIEVQSPSNPIWDSLFSDKFDSDFTLVYSPRKDFSLSSPRREYMILSSPKRDYMISSPKRDYMFSSPKRDYMNSSPKRDYMISSPKRDYMFASPKTSMGSMSSSVYTQSPLHRVFNSSTSYSCSTENDIHRDRLVLPSMDALLNEYMNYDESKDNVEIQSGVEGMSATLLECINYENNLGVGEESKSSDNHTDVYDARAHDHGYGMIVGSSDHGVLGYDQNEQQEQDNGMQLVHILLACAESIAKEDYNSARCFLQHLNKLASPMGDSMQRVASCFADALYLRLSPPIARFSPSVSVSLDTLRLYQILYQACPYVKFAHFTANQAIFEALEFEDRVHVIDLDILQGYQWPAFLQALAARPQGPPTLRITGVGHPAEIVNETGRHLAELAHSLGVPFEFHAAVAEQLQDLRPHMLHRKVGEALAVNSVNRLHRVSGPHLGNLLAMIRDQAPNIVTLVEQEASHNSPNFLSRFLEALHYYSAIFDSLDATFPSDSSARAKVEQYLFLPEIRNIVGCEGIDRVERHEKLEKWRRIMESKGFSSVPLSQNASTQSEILLSLYSCDGYRLSMDDGCLLLGWQDRAIVAASAWRC